MQKDAIIKIRQCTYCVVFAIEVKLKTNVEKWMQVQEVEEQVESAVESALDGEKEAIPDEAKEPAKEVKAETWTLRKKWHMHQIN